ncbi:MAG TPA: type I secretion system permease/ATPase [Sphingomonas sp.]|nr:type I secretion system permease/ATPase [Sphingomonas sp.]
MATMRNSGGPKPLPSPLARALRLGVAPIGFAALFSLISNMLYLALPIYTNQIYSRVLSSQSVATLFVLSLGCAFVFLVSAIIDHYRAQVLSGFGVVFDQQLASRTFAALFDAVVRRRGTRAQALRDLDAVRSAIGGQAIAIMFDLPWIPIFLVILFFIDPTIGAVTLSGGLVLVLLAFLQDRATHSALKEASEAAIASYGYTDAALRNGEVVRALGMLPTLGRQWARNRYISVAASSEASQRGGFYSGAIRFVRMFIQILIIAVGAWLVLERKIPSGLLFANMILASRALAPLERIVGSWKALVEAVQAYKRLDRILLEYEPPEPVTQLPRPTGALSVEQVSFAPYGAPALVLINLNFKIEPGDFVGVIGPSGAGKSTLARLMAGIWKPNSGTVRLDGADVYTWDRENFGSHVAYQPQDTELFAGTVRDNIARFLPEATDAEVVAAAKLAGAHELILRLPKGYESDLGEGGMVLSAGQRQRVGLARTLFGDPSLIILDEPNANLDPEGEAALMAALAQAKARGATIVLISHKPQTFAQADKMILLVNGQIVEYGPRDQVMARFTAKPPTQPPQPPGRATLTEVGS